MDHIVYLDAKEKEMGMLLNGEKRMIIRGAAGRKLPHGRVHPGETLWFIENGGDGLVWCHGTVKAVLNSERLNGQQSEMLISEHQPMLCLTPNQIKRWSGKRYLVLIEVENVRAVSPFGIDRSGYGNMDDWLPTEDIERVKRQTPK